MKVVIAIDSFKGSMSSLEAGNAVKEGIKKVYKDADVIVKPLADGGEGTTETLTNFMGGDLRNIEVTGPLGKKVMATYGIIQKNKTAIMEMSSASGITLVLPEERNPFLTTTFGVGEMIKDAIKNGCRKFIVGIGGSATNDGGAGMLQALGFSLLDKNKNEIPFGGINLKNLSKIKFDKVLPELKECSFQIACDVNNPLCGKYGASHIYAPQKGANPDMVLELDEALLNFANIVKKYFQNSDMNYEGAGAAGGLGFGFLSFTNSNLHPGIKIVLNAIKIEEDIKDADFVITGEGRLDRQTSMGKAPIGVARLAKKYNKKVIAFSGVVSEDADECNKNGIDAFFPILRRICTIEEAMDIKIAKNNITETTIQVFNLIKKMEDF